MLGDSMIRSAVSGTVLAFLLASAAQAQTSAPATQPPATVAGADAFVAEAEKTLAEKSVGAQQVAWVNATYITDDTDALAAASGAEMTDLAVRYGLGAARYRRCRACPMTRSASSTCCAAVSRCRPPPRLAPRRSCRC